MPSRFWDTESGNFVFLPSHSIRSIETGCGNRVAEGNLDESRAAFCAGFGVSERLASYSKNDVDSFFRSIHNGIGAEDEEEEVSSARSVEHFKEHVESYMEKESKCLCSSSSIRIEHLAERGETSAGQVDSRTKDLLPLLANGLKPCFRTIQPILGNLNDSGIPNSTSPEDIVCDRHLLVLDLGLASRNRTVEPLEALKGPVSKKPVTQEGSKLASFTNEGKKNVDGDWNFDFTAENDVGYLNTEDVLVQNYTVSAKASSSNSSVCHCPRKGKGKEKLLHFGHSNGRTWKDCDDGERSVESCGSANSCPRGKRRRSFDLECIQINGSKGIKSHFHGAPSNSHARQGSSFMTWISTVVKGTTKSPNHDHGRHKRKPYRDEHLESSSGKVGFRALFQSLYGKNAKESENVGQVDNGVCDAEDPVNVDTEPSIDFVKNGACEMTNSGTQNSSEPRKCPKKLASAFSTGI